MTFGEALEELEFGKKVQRLGWNGKDMWIYLCKNYTTHDVPFNVDFTTGRKRLPFIIMKTVSDDLVPWLASQTDILAKDWKIVI